MSDPLRRLLALDIGSARIGVATANTIARIASPHSFIPNNDEVIDAIVEIIKTEQIDELIVGLPLNIEGKETEQTKYINQFVAKLKPQLDIPTKYSDESSTSKLAEQQLNAAKKQYDKGDSDALSASYILQRYLDDATPVKVSDQEGLETIN